MSNLHEHQTFADLLKQAQASPTVLQHQLLEKGDLPGHPFRGNQHTGGAPTGGHGSDPHGQAVLREQAAVAERARAFEAKQNKEGKIEESWPGKEAFEYHDETLRSLSSLVSGGKSTTSSPRASFNSQREMTAKRKEVEAYLEASGYRAGNGYQGNPRTEGYGYTFYNPKVGGDGVRVFTISRSVYGKKEFILTVKHANPGF